MPDLHRRRRGFPSMDDQLLLGEALVWLPLAHLALRLVPFGVIARFVTLRSKRAAPPFLARAAPARRIARAVAVAARLARWAGGCFPQALACHVMLARRRLPSRLFYGARNCGPSGPSAHVWVRSGDLDLVGAETAADFAILATFPPLEDTTAGR